MAIKIARRGFLMGTAAIAGLSLANRAMAAEGLRLMFWGSQSRADRTYAAADLFTAARGINVEGEFLGWGDYWPKLATLTAGENAPDVIQMDYRYIVEYAKRSAIAPLDEFVGSTLMLDGFDADQLEGGKVDGKLYGISLGANSAATIVNLTAFEEAGVAVPDNAWTYEVLATIGEGFKKANIRGGMRAIADCSYSEGAFENWLRQRGKALYTAEGKLGYEVADLTEWYQMWAMLREAGHCVTPEDQALDTGANETSMLVLGKAAMGMLNSNQLVGYQALLQDSLGLLSFPRIAEGQGGGHYRKPAMMFSIAATSTAKAEAADFVNFFISDAKAAEALGVERGIPCLESTRQVVAPLLDAPSRLAMDYVTSLGDLLGPIPPAPPKAAGEIDSSLFRTAGQEVGFAVRSPEDAAAYVHAEAQALLERAG